jgi:HAD superfamily hydrolase (TIGR01549 family)
MKELREAKIKAIIFDWDGTLVDTAILNSQAWHQILLRHGRDVPADKIVPYIGTSGSKIIRTFFDSKLDEATVKAFLKEKSEFYTPIAERMGTKLIFPGVKEVLAFLRSRKIRIGLGSAGTKATVVALLKSTGLGKDVDCLVSVDDVGGIGKPDPAIFLEAARRIGCSPSETIIVGDADADMVAGKRGGFCATVQVLNDGIMGVSANADIVIKNLNDLVDVFP